MSDLDTPTRESSVNSSTLPRSAKRCRIPRLNRSVSVRTPQSPLKSEGRPKSLTAGSSDYPWRFGDPLGSSMHSMPPFDDDSSVKSFGSYASYASFASQSQCGTEASLQGSRPVSRSHYGKRYVLHCDRHMVKPEEYLTPTQRKEKEIRQLKSALARQTKRCDDKDAEIEELREEMGRLRDTLAELQLGKHNLMNSSQESDNLEESMNVKNNNSSVISFASNSSDDIHTVTNNNNDDSGISTSISPRNSSEEFDDIVREKVDKCVSTDDCVKPKPEVSVDSSKPKAEVNADYSKSKAEVNVEYSKPNTDVDYSKSKAEVTVDNAKSKAELNDGVVAQSVRNGVASVESHQSVGAMSVAPSEFERFLGVYKQELEQLKSQHREHYQDLKERFNDRVDDLLQKLTEANTRYLELRPLFERAQDKIHTIENQLSDVQKDMETQEDYHNQMYLRMYRKGQEAARFVEEEDGLEFNPKPLRQQLQQLENELEQTRRLYREATSRGSGDRQAEYTLRFLKDAVFYFLTKKDKEHLKAIQSILGFTDAERMAVAKAMKHRRL